ncbi:UNVERIFIED_CONTAM: putative ribonuclease H protein [Sesamum calycinum]|uniref:Ribonuclease H protein n=1 Tax=Sesamum calycinum TaxID=2727403 RepID=A0AAW2Q3L2_9LAMI
MEVLRDFLRAYGRVSGQLINDMKSSFIVGHQVSSLQTQAVQYVLGYQLKHLPVMYLGVPLYKGIERHACLTPSFHVCEICSKSGILCLGLFHEVWWRFRNKSFLWSKYLHGCYYRNLHPTVVPYSRNHSSIWHRLCRIRDVAEPFLFWTLGEGSVSFWHDNWLGEKPLAQLLHSDTYIMEPTICRIPIAVSQGDKIVWTGSSAGDFSTKSAWEAIRQASPRRQLLADVWHRSLQPTISVFLWRLFQDRILVDARMRQKGFSFPSKCQYCETEETISHLFIESTAVQGVWQHFAALFGLCLCYGALLAYHGVPFSTDGIILEVQRHLCTLYVARTLTSTQWKGDLYRVGVLGFIFHQTVPRAPSIMRWRAPSPSWFKLNTDGSSFGNPGLAGPAGIIRDSAGHVHLAYQVALGTGASVLLELTVVWRGVELALNHGLATLVVGVDATAVISLLQSRVFGKEANGAVDHLVKEAASLQLTRVLHHNDITGVLHGILCLDRRGIPHLCWG